MAKETSDVEKTIKAKQFSQQVANPLQQMGNDVERSCLKIRWEQRVTTEQWYLYSDDLLKHLKAVTVSSPRKVRKPALQDARKLFGANFDTKLTLRKAGHPGANEDIILVQFDPNFTATEVVCRHPSCNIRNPKAAKCGQKRDLYLCSGHRQGLRNAIGDVLVKNNLSIPTSTEMLQPARFAGYTSLISLLEGAYHDAKKFDTLKGKSPVVEEAILNVRNFLIITSTMLNPDEDNLEVVLPPVYRILCRILEIPGSILSLKELVGVLRDVIQIILSAFGVVYTWVSVALKSPGAQIGAGVGGFIGGAVLLLFGPWAAIGGAAVGGVLGALTGNGIYNLVAGDPMPQQIESFRRDWVRACGAGPNAQPNNQCPIYYFEGNESGGLYLQAFTAA